VRHAFRSRAVEGVAHLPLAVDRVPVRRHDLVPDVHRSTHAVVRVPSVRPAPYPGRVLHRGSDEGGGCVFDDEAVRGGGLNVIFVDI